jgi:parvulin-like peptidyl-prolyl isomerase
MSLFLPPAAAWFRWLLAAAALAQPGGAEAPTAADDGGEAIVATVGGEPIRRREVERMLAEAFGSREIEPAARPSLEAALLDELIARRLVLAYARRTGAGPSGAEIEAAVEAFEKRLAARGQSLEEHLRAERLGPDDLRRQVAWQLVWPKLVARYATEERLEAHFKAHRREFDGSEVLASQILLRPEGEDRQAAFDAAVARARQLREQILAGKLDFAEAARRHSAAPSAAEGGRVGWIERRGAMPEPVARAAFALAPGQVSEPVVTPLGVHLVRCEEVKPGRLAWTDVRPALVESLARELLSRLAAYERPRAPVERR